MNYKVFLSVVAFMGASVHGASSTQVVTNPGPVEQKSGFFGGFFGGDKVPAASTAQALNPPQGNSVAVGGQLSGPVVNQNSSPSLAQGSAVVAVKKGSRKDCMAWIRDQKVPVSGDFKVYLESLSANPAIKAALDAEATPPIQDDVRIPDVCKYKSKTYRFIGKANAVSYAVHLVAKEESKKKNEADQKQAEEQHKAKSNTHAVPVSINPGQNVIPSGPVNSGNTGGAPTGGPKTQVVGVTTTPPAAVVTGSTGTGQQKLPSNIAAPVGAIPQKQQTTTIPPVNF